MFHCLSQCRICLATALTLAAFICSAAIASDWPMYKKDTDRSSVSDESLKFPMRLAWRYVSAQPAHPAWPQPPRLFHKMDFDYAPHPVVAEGIVSFGSTADDTIRALDARTGKLRWQFTTGGPVRFAPQIDAGRVYAASDDGVVYCLDAETGKPVWTFSAAPTREMYLGNQRMISRWPIRTGVLVEDGVLYCVAGIWPSEGIYVYALDAASGEVRWLNDTSGLLGNRASGSWSARDPHMGEFSYTGTTPQGALLTSRDTLIVPLGNNAPAAFSKQTGKLLRFIGQGTGSSWVAKDGDMSYTYLIFRSGVELFGAKVADKGLASGVNRFTRDKLPQVSTWANRASGVDHRDGKVSSIIHSEKLYAEVAYGLALASEALFVGEKDAIAALKAGSREEIWRAPVTGEAREIAVAGGRIYVATDRGEISCFEAAGSAAAAPVLHEPAKSFSRPAAGENDAAHQLVEELTKRDMVRGYLLIAGDATGQLSTRLTDETDLKIVSILDDPEAVGRLRDKLLATTSLYGSRIHVLALDDFGRLPFAQYFANAVIVADSVAGLSGKELYRMLRPYGGVLLMPGLQPEQAEALARQVDTSPQEFAIVRALGRAAIVRGELAGARNWNANTGGDRRVRWPLRPLWFGGPDSSLVMNWGIGAHPPVASEGRYFVTGQDSLTAVDAYNGTEIWTRPIPSATPNVHAADGLQYLIAGGLQSHTTDQWSNIKRWIAADGRHVYLRLGENYFRGQGEALLQLDARTGEQVALAGPFVPGPMVSITSPQTWSLEVDDRHSGTLSLERTAAGLRVTLATKDPQVTRVDGWDLFFDLRPHDKRYGLYSQGTFMVTVTPAQATGEAPIVASGAGPSHPKFELLGARTADGTQTTLVLPWSEMERLAGSRPQTFGFAATLNAYDGVARYKKMVNRKEAEFEMSQVEQRYLFGDAMAPSLNNGWANVRLEEDANEAERPAVIAGAFDSRPSEWPLPEIAEEVYLAPPGSVDEKLRLMPRTHPLTGEPGPRVYRSGTAGCGNPVFSATCAIGRSNKLALGFYDFAEDSGLHFFPGIASNCGARIKAVNMTAALGLLIFSESRSHCDCMVPIRTSLAFAPAERKLEEDWAIFFERNADAPIRRAAINFGAFGDRRDDAGTMWLTMPRAVSGKAFPIEPGTRRWIYDAPPMSSTIDVPLQFESDQRARGAYRVNADRVKIDGTDRPWVYTSGYRGITKAVLSLLPVKPLKSQAVEQPIMVDGHLDEAGWNGTPEAVLSFTQTDVLVRHDAKNLYLAARRKPTINRLGKVAPWVGESSGEDADVEGDDSWEVFLSDRRSGRVLHLAVSASGARYDALAIGNAVEDRSWSGSWTSAVRADDEEFIVEAAIPFSTLSQAGLAAHDLAVNFLANRQNLEQEIPYWPGSAGRELQQRPGVGEPLLSLGIQGRARCGNFVPLGLGDVPEAPRRKFTIRLHFAELEDVQPGERVFDVTLQGQVVLKDFDVVKEAGGPTKALVRQFDHVEAGETLTLEFIPAAKHLTTTSTPILSALEVVDESFDPQKK